MKRRRYVDGYVEQCKPQRLGAMGQRSYPGEGGQLVLTPGGGGALVPAHRVRAGYRGPGDVVPGWPGIPRRPGVPGQDPERKYGLGPVFPGFGRRRKQDEIHEPWARGSRGGGGGIGTGPNASLHLPPGSAGRGTWFTDPTSGYLPRPDVPQPILLDVPRPWEPRDARALLYSPGAPALDWGRQSPGQVVQTSPSFGGGAGGPF